MFNDFNEQMMMELLFGSVEEMMVTINDIKSKVNKLSYAQFLCVMCMIFDEYAFAHAGEGQEFKAADMAQIVADQVKAVNSEYGAYKG